MSKSDEMSDVDIRAEFIPKDEEAINAALEEHDELGEASETLQNKRRKIEALKLGQAIFAKYDDGNSTATNEALDQLFFRRASTASSSSSSSSSSSQAAAATNESSSSDGDSDSDDSVTGATRGGGRAQKVTRGWGGGSNKTTTTTTTTNWDDNLVAECVDLQVKLLVRLKKENKINRRDLRKLNALMKELCERT
jgi:hypothetical protein